MATKLTLRLDEELIRRAKKYSARRKKSLSALVAGYFSALEREAPQESVPPAVASLRGVLKGKGGGEDDYKRYLEEKYL